MSWWRSLARRSYHAAPAAFWRNVEGLFWDLRSVPERLRDPSRRGDPWEVFHHVGGGDYRTAGLAVMGMLRQEGGLAPTDAVLDIGCGNGRMTLPLSDFLADEGRYVGFDVSRSAIDYCRRRFAGRPNFAFHHLDIHNGVYNPKGRLAEDTVDFPVETSAITLAFATSVLTHLSMPTIRRYMAQTRRVLAPGGRALFTAFVLTPEVRAMAAEGRTTYPMQPFGDGCMTIDPHWPENGLAYDEALFRQAAADAGLTLTSILHGEWSGAPTYAGGQDLLILEG